MNEPFWVYLVVHATITLGGLILFLLRWEHRMTRLETKVEYIEKKFHSS